ncbi:MAG TPA: thiamine-phosphate kinase [Pyrinomonadaceae bacterium]|jgi:thiamine-monophosphate kinase
MRAEKGRRKLKAGSPSSTSKTLTSNSARRDATPGEFDFITRIRRRAERHNKLAAPVSSLIPHPSSLLHGIGDDAAVISHAARSETVITADLLVEDVDFRRATMPPRALGHKALAVSLSDIAAMGARPRYALLSVGVPAAVWRTRFLGEFYEGFFALAARAGVALVGGDVSRTPERIAVDSIVLGEVRRGRAVLRAGARPGDQIFVTGTLGGAAAGLQLLERAPPRRRGAAATQLVRRHQRPEPRLAWGAWLGAKRLATAMIDLSDGLSSDLTHLCRASRVGALVVAADVPVEPLINESGAASDAALALALHGGEDFELLFTARPEDAARLPAALDGVHVTRIGEIRPRAAGLRLHAAGRTRKLTPGGFTHFRAPR